MDHFQYLAHLADEFGRLRAVVGAADLTSEVPSCPGWTIADLARHVGQVYLHKTQSLREGAEPAQWPPSGLAGEEPLVLLDRGYAELTGEFAVRRPQDPAGTWYAPDQSVGFLMRRMAQETVIHRIDAELASGQPVVPVPDDLAVDGIDELLTVFVAYGVREWSSYFTGILDGSPGRTATLRAGGAGWRVRTGPGLFAVEDVPRQDGAGVDPAEVTVSGAPADVLRWLWNRETSGEASMVTIEGDADAVTELRRCIVVATQ